MNLKKMRTWAEINLDNFKNNIEVIKKHIGNEKMLMAVIKANAYGHGVTRIAIEAVNAGCDYLAVACIDEAIQIRKADIDIPVLILSHISEDGIPDLIDYNIIPTVFNKEMPEKISDYARKINKTVKVHIKLDTGMTRLGFDASKVNETVEDILYINNLDGIEIEGIFTHFADADNEGGTFTEEQYLKYKNIVNELEKRGLDIPVKHTCNSAGIISKKDMHLNMVRAGIILYGYYPEKYLENIMPGILPVLEIKSSVFQIKEVEEDITVGYGRTYKTENKKKIGVIPIGYADGYSRLLSNKFYVLVCGKKVNIIGRICMDQLMVDLTEIDNVCEGTVVTIIGKDGENSITAQDIANELKTISYEVLCDIGRRIPRIYFKNGKVDSFVNYLE